MASETALIAVLSGKCRETFNSLLELSGGVENMIGATAEEFLAILGSAGVRQEDYNATRSQRFDFAQDVQAAAIRELHVEDDGIRRLRAKTQERFDPAASLCGDFQRRFAGEEGTKAGAEEEGIVGHMHGEEPGDAALRHFLWRSRGWRAFKVGFHGFTLRPAIRLNQMGKA